MSFSVAFQDILSEYTLVNKEPLCGLERLSVAAEESGFREYNEYCSTNFIEEKNTTLANASFPKVSFDVVAQEYTYIWRESSYVRQVKHTKCLFCPDESIVLIDPSDIIFADAAQLKVQADKQKSEVLVYYYFIELENNSTVACQENGTLSVPPLHSRRVPEILPVCLVIISLVSLIITLITYCVFAELRNFPGKIIMNFTTALFFALLSIVLDHVLPPSACVAAGPAFHYFWLAAFTWMNALSINITMTLTQTTPLRKPTGNKKLYRYMVYGWGAPGAIVSIPLALHFCDCTDMIFKYGAVVDKMNRAQYCWLAGDAFPEILFYTVVVGILTSVNLLLFIYTLCKLRRATKSVRSSRHSKRKKWYSSDSWIFLKVRKSRSLFGDFDLDLWSKTLWSWTDMVLDH